MVLQKGRVIELNFQCKEKWPIREPIRSMGKEEQERRAGSEP